MQPHPRTLWRHVGPTTWHLIRHAYLSGASAPAVAARYGVSVSSIRKRAAREGWTKRRYALSLIQDPGAAIDADAGGPDGAPSAALSEAEALPGAAGDPLVRQATPAEGAFARRLWPLPDIEGAVLARKALVLADMALRQGRAIDVRRFAEAARAINQLDEHLPWTHERPDPDAADLKARQMADFIGEMAVRFALDLQRGEPLPPQYATHVARYEAARAREGDPE